MPTTVTGRLKLTPGSRLSAATLVFDIIERGVVYGPIMAFSGALTERIYKADGKRVLMRVRPPRRHSEMPQAVSCLPD